MCKICSEFKQRGFKGFFSFKELRKSSFGKIAEVPILPGIYVVVNHVPKKKPDFMEEGTGGWPKGKNPNVAKGILGKKWREVKNTKILYIGQGKSLQNRINQYEKFGRGRKVPHRGGRYIWQLPNSEHLIIAWKIVKENPRQKEKELLKEFELKYENLPFANLQH